MEINSKTAIVTGASKGLGRALSIALIEKGAVVFGLARSKSDLDNLRSKLGDKFHPVALDISKSDAVDHWVKSTFSAENHPAILINNAGAGYFAKIDELSSEKWHQMINTNLNAVYYLTSAIVPLMKAAEKSNHIVNIGSILGKVSSAEKAGYSASKFAIQGFSESLYKELRGNNIKVTCINPGSIDTRFFEESGIEPNRNMLQPKDLAATVIHVLETPDNVLINELSIRPLDARPD